MKQFTLVLVLAVAALTTSCASGPTIRSDKQCSDTPRNALVTFLQGIRDILLGPILSVIPDGVSYKDVLVDKNSRRGNEVIQEILKSPVVGGGVNCNCEVIHMISTSDLQMKEALIERTDVDDGGKLHYSRRTFHVFFTRGNCIPRIVPKDDAWRPV